MPRTIWTTRWTYGPNRPGGSAGSAGPGRAGGPGGLVVSVTEFTTYRPWHAFGVAASARRLRDTWPETDGAVALLLWARPHPLRPVSGSVSVWSDPAALRAFVARPDHGAIVRDYRGRGDVRAATTLLADADLRAAWRWARPLLTQQQPWPGA